MHAITKGRSAPDAVHARDFARLCRLYAQAKGDNITAAHTELDAQSSYVHNVFTKSDPGMIGGGGSPDAWGNALADFKVLANAFLATLRSVGVFDAMLPDMLRLPFRTRVALSLATVNGDDVDEGALKLVHEMEFGADTLDFRKASAMVIVSDELMRLANTEGLIEAELRAGVVGATDRDFLAKLIAATTPVASSGSVLEDLATLFATVETGSASRWYFVIPVEAAAQLATTPSLTNGQAYPDMGPTDGRLGAIPVLTSDQLTNTAVLVDASVIAAAAEGLTVQVASHGTVDLNNGESPSQPVSLWQKNLKGILVERFWDATVLRSSRVASLSGVSYSGGSPS
jgi:hypothetical protein